MAQMIAFEVDNTTRPRDIKLTNGQVSLVEDQYAVAQRLRVRLNTNTGEWFLDTTFGVPYRERILVKAPNIGVVSALIVAVIAGCPGILRVNEYEFDVDFVTRILSGDVIAQSIWGDIRVEVEPEDLIPIMIVTVVGPSQWLP